jgi:glycosyltransferase involved in cell wall biosynthesis
MRVLKTVQSYYPFQERGGTVFKVRALARSLAHRGHQISVLTADLGLNRRSENNFHVEHCRWGWRAEEDGVEAIYLPTFGHFRALTVNPGLVKFCEASLSQYDLVHFYGIYDFLGPAVSHFCRRAGIPYVIEPMGMYRPIDRSFRLKRLWHRMFGHSYVEHAAKIVATSEMEQQDLLAQGVPAERIIIRYNGVEIDRCAASPRGSFRTKWAISPNDTLIFFLSRLIPRKGADILIQAFSQVCPQSGTLVIAGPEGETGYVNYLKKCAAENRVANRVLFTGPLYDSEKAAAYADSDIFVLASYYENFANVVAEAVACDIPVVVSNMCGIHSLVDGRAGLVTPVDRDSVAAALRRLLTDKVLYAQLKAGCRKVASELTWGTISGQMENYYVQVLARPGRIQSTAGTRS